jgi:hypothetical protein
VRPLIPIIRIPQDLKAICARNGRLLLLDRRRVEPRDEAIQGSEDAHDEGLCGDVRWDLGSFGGEGRGHLEVWGLGLGHSADLRRR